MDCVFRKLFAFFANRLRFSQKSIVMLKKEPVKKSTMYGVFYSQERKRWVWQIGDERFCERHFSQSKNHAEKESKIIIEQYELFEKQFQSTAVYEKMLWQKDKKDGYIGRYGAFEFWISPINHVKSGLWRYDIYHAIDTKSVCYGVAQSIVQAQLACVRFACVAKL
jgi:hypothetical protein